MTVTKKNGKRHLFDDPRNVRRVLVALFLACAVALGLDTVVLRHLTFKEGGFDAEGFWGFYAAYGFVACVVLVVAAKWLRRLLMRDEDYYDR